MAMSPLSLVVENGTGKTNSNSYCTVEEADEYHLSRFNSASWQNTTSHTRETALVWATRLLDESVDWAGEAANTDQALGWPRIGVQEKNHYQYFDHNEIPTWLKNATAELARYLINEDRTAEPDDSGYSSIKVGPISLEIDKSDRKSILPRSVKNMVSHYAHIYGEGTIRLARS
jgi:hypothetical protein